MKTPPPPEKPTFQKTEVPCLYRYSSNGVYYALAKHEGKQKRASLETTDKAVAKRKRADFQRDPGKVDSSSGHLTLRELCARYLATVQNQSAATARRKKDIVAPPIADFSAGTDVRVSKIKTSEIQTWLADHAPTMHQPTRRSGDSSHNLYVECVQAIFRLAVIDKAIIKSPADDVKRKKVVKPVRITPPLRNSTLLWLTCAPRNSTLKPRPVPISWHLSAACKRLGHPRSARRRPA